jgi:predicted P-loop ATPase
MLTTYYTADENDYTKAVGKNFMIGMVARIYQPGCKQDCMMILEGAQGNFKTTSLETLGGKWYSTASASPDNKDFFVNLRGCMIVEIKELDNFRKADATLIKKILDTPYDDYRPPYGMVNERFLRQSIFVGTTNEKEYLKDNTGARRFYPIMTHAVKLDDIKRDRDQLFAEAVVRYKAKESWWEVPLQECLEEQESRRQSDTWEDIIAEFLAYKSEVSTFQICQEALKIDIARIDQHVEKRVSKIMRLHKWSKDRYMGTDGVRRYLWRSPKFYSEPDV